jgi:hypothetical protein
VPALKKQILLLHCVQGHDDRYEWHFQASEASFDAAQDRLMRGRLVLAAAAGYGCSGFLVGFPAAFGFALVPILFALGYG